MQKLLDSVGECRCVKGPLFAVGVSRQPRDSPFTPLMEADASGSTMIRLSTQALSYCCEAFIIKYLLIRLVCIEVAELGPQYDIGYLSPSYNDILYIQNRR